METRNLVSPSDQGQKEAFLNELNQFLSDKGRFLCRTPNLAGRTIDLHDLYNKVTSAGGYHKVTDRGYWEDFLDVYGYPASSSTLAYGLQKIYQLYLEDYERVHYFGDDEPQPYFRSFPGGYRKYRYKITDMQRMQSSMNMQKPCVSDYDRVVLSLESCLPNEIDFAVNACTLLSGESRHVLRLPQCRRIVDALLLHAGIVSDGHDSYCEVLEELQNRTKHNYRKFWNNSIAKKSVIPVLLPIHKKDQELHQSDGKEESREAENKKSSDINFTDALQRRLQDIEQDDSLVEELDNSDSKVAKKSKWSELFHGHRSLGVEDYEGQRVLQIALVLLNLSFEEFNVSLLARHPSLIRFVFLCVHSEYSCLRQTGLDILSNISSHMQLLHLQYDVMSMIFDTINTAVLSHDKFERIRGFEILGNICRRRPNIERISVYVCDNVYDAAVQNLMVTDVEILLAAIEALYRLSKLGETTCTKIIFIKGCIDILMCLVTLNVRTFGQEKLSEIRLARKILPGQSEQSSQHQQLALPAYHVPTQQHVAHSSQTVLMQRQMQLQQQAKFGSAHQATPTFAPAAAMVPPAAAPVATQARPPQPQPSLNINPPLNAQPKIEPNPTPPPQPHMEVQQQKLPQPPQTGLPQPSQTTPQPPPPVVSSPPPIASPQPQVKTSPPGAGPTYTHSETGTVPPVFHYMPAPPNNILQDRSPESFTKLWIWATYESQAESYIPRVDVYCEYLASSNRYGRQGKTEILSATDFGKCLKQIFPQATSRLFNQGRGQPQYHIAGIKKRATPLPVPGHQLKDSHSVFSPDSDEVDVSRRTPPVTVTSKTRATATTTLRPNMPSPPVPVASTAVPIQQLQFQPILIVSAVPGTNNVALLSGGQLATTTAIFNTSNQTAIALQQQPVADISSQTLTITQPEVQAPQAAAELAMGTQESTAGPLSTTGSDKQVTISCDAEIVQVTQDLTSTTTTKDLDGKVDTVSTSQTDNQVTSGIIHQINPGLAAVTSEPSSAIITPASDTSVSQKEAECQISSSSEQTNLWSGQTTSELPPEGAPVVPAVAGKTLESEEDGKMDTNFSKSRNHMPDDSTEMTDSLPNTTNVKDNTETSDQFGNGLEISPKGHDAKMDDHNHTANEAVTNGYIEGDSLKDGINENPKKETLHKLKDKDGDKTSSEQTKKARKRRRTKSKDKTRQMVNGITEDLCKKDTTLSDDKAPKNNGPNGPTLNELSYESKNVVNGESETEAAVNSILDPSDTSVDDIMKMDISDVILSPTPSQKSFETEIGKVQGEEQKSGDSHFTHPGKEEPKDETENVNINELVASVPIDDICHAPQAESGSASECPVSGNDGITVSSCQQSETVTVSICHMSETNVPVVLNCTSQTAVVVTVPSSNINTCLSMTPTTQTVNSDTQIQMTPTNPIPHSALNQRLKDTITRRKNSQLSPSSTPNNSLPPSVIQQYSYKMQDNQSLAQQIIPITPQQLQHQYHQQKHAPPSHTNHPEQSYQGTVTVGTKRSAITATVGPPLKMQRPAHPPPMYTPNPSQYHPAAPRPPVPTITHRPPHPQVAQQHHAPQRPNTPLANNPHQAGTQPKAKPPTIDLMAPNASLLVLYRNVGKIPFANHMDEKEDAISKSVRLTAALILTNIARYSNLGRSLLQKHEDNLARVAMSQMDCSPIVARLLSELDV